MNPSTASFQRDQRDIFRGSLVNIGGFLVRMASRVPFLFIAGHLYGAALYGEFVLVQALVESADVLATFGFRLTLFRFLHEDGERSPEDIVRHVLVLTLTLALAFSIAMWLGAGAIASVFRMPAAGPKIAIVAWMIPVYVLTDLLLAATWAKRVVHFDVIARSIVEPATLTIGSFVFYRLGYQNMGLPAAYVAGFLGAACAAAISFARLYSLRGLFHGRLRLSYLVALARRSASTSVHDAITLLLSRIDVFAVGYFFGDAAVGLYGMAQQFLTVMDKITVSFSPVLIPVLTEALRSRDIHRARSQLLAVGRRILTMQTPVVIVFLLAGPVLLRLIGPAFDAAWAILLVLTLGSWVNGTLGLSELALLTIRPDANPKASSLRLGLYAIVLLPFRAALGPAGVALANVLATLIANAVRALVCLPTLRLAA